MRKLLLALLLLSIVNIEGQVTKPVQVYNLNGVLQWPTNFWDTNNIILIMTNGVPLGIVQKINFTTGVTGYVSAGIAHLGVSVTAAAPGSTNYMLLQTGDFLLLQTGGKMQLQ